MRKLTRNLKLKNEWSDIEVAGVEKLVQEYFSEYTKIKNVIDFFGLPYTSSSSFAALWNTNTTFTIEEGINLIGFAITENNILVAIGEDSEENNYLYRLEKEEE